MPRSSSTSTILEKSMLRRMRRRSAPCRWGRHSRVLSQVVSPTGTPNGQRCWKSVPSMCGRVRGNSRNDAACPPSSSATIKDRKSVVEGKSVSVRVDLGGRRILKKKKEKIYTAETVYIKYIE